MLRNPSLSAIIRKIAREMEAHCGHQTVYDAFGWIGIDADYESVADALDRLFPFWWHGCTRDEKILMLYFGACFLESEEPQ